MTNIERFQSDLASARRVVQLAPPATRAEAFLQVSREAVRIATVGGVAKPDVIDALREIGLDGGLDDEDVQDVLVRAVQDPFDPTKTKAQSNAGTAAMPGKAHLIIRRASEIEPKPIDWLWAGRIALGKQTILAGEPGLGKSQLTCAVASSVTTGGRWPNNEGVAPGGSVIILSAEDDAADTIRPRLDAAGADASKVHILSAVKLEGDRGRRSFSLQGDLVLLEEAISGIGDVKLVIIDPVSSYLGKVDSHKNAELRAVLEPIGEMAARLGVAVLSITHLNKGGGGTANSRFIGSIAFVAAARAAFIVCRDPDDPERRLFLPSKNNLGRDSGGLAFKIGEFSTPSGVIAPAVMWDVVPVTMTADQALSPASPSTQRDDAEDFLRDQLANGPMKTKDIQAEAKAADMSWATVRRAKDKLKVTVTKSKEMDGAWLWSLPEQPPDRAHAA